ncbi:hypothetical protein NMG60_11001277 [Bertholletia excelsa]
MGESLLLSQSILLPQLRFHGTAHRNCPGILACRSELTGFSFGIASQLQQISLSSVRVVSDPNPATVFNLSAGEKVTIIEPDIGGGDGLGGGDGGGEGGGGDGGGGGGGDNSDENDAGGGSGESDSKEKTAMSMSQKLTLGYALLVGVGGVMGYLKSGSQKSLMSGGLSALLLYYVYTQLPARPAFASSIGFGISAALLAVMGSRFKKSGKIFPAGVVSVVSLVMSGGYIHGILRSLH